MEKSADQSIRLLTPLLVLCLPGCINAVTHETTLLWTEKELNGDVKIMGIPGEPSTWINGGNIKSLAQAYPSDPAVRAKSHRIALAFNYNQRRLYFSDRGYKQIFQIKLRTAPELPFIYNVTVETLYNGISTEVNGMAVDWASGSVYWTDALYNWITVASAIDSSVYRHLITTGLDSPQGIAVHPQKGELYWSDWGSVPRIERSSLSGKDRQVLVTSGLSRPLGMTVDYSTSTLYWVDDDLDTIERSDLNGQNRHSFKVDQSATPFRNNLFGIAVYQNYVFVTDQFSMSVKVYNKPDEAYLGRFGMRAIPYDIMMYDAKLQEEIQSECSTLDCEHMCISEANGRAHCLCAQSHQLGKDGRSCQKMATFRKPSYLYSIGSSLCMTHIHVTDIDPGESGVADVNCFLNGTDHAEALAFDVNADMLFFSETKTGTLNRMRLEDGEEHTSIHLNRGQIRGIAVDWLSSNLYWTDEELGHIMMSRLDGSHATPLVEARDEVYRPRGIAVNPLDGTMYWSSGTNIYTAHLDGTNIRRFPVNCTAPDGMVLDINTRRLHWVDMDGIYSAKLNGSDVSQDVKGDTASSYRDVTVYEDYMAWTDGKNYVYFTTKDEDRGYIQAVRHASSPVSHDIITYDTYLQPLYEGQCDAENGGCQHLCFPKPSGRRSCGCAVGFYLHSNGFSCVSDLWRHNFVLFVDPFHKHMFQLHLDDRTPSPQGIDTDFLDEALHVSFDQEDVRLYWYEEGHHVIKTALLTDPKRVRVLLEVSPDIEVGGMDLSYKTKQLFFTDIRTRSIYYVYTDPGRSRKPVLYHARNVIPGSIVVHHKHQVLYWAEETDYREATIYRSALSDTLTLQQVRVRELQVKGLALDMENDYIYYYTNNEVYQYNEVTHHEKQVLEASGKSIYHKVAVDGDNMYISDISKGAVMLYDMSTMIMVRTSSAVFSQITDLKVYRGQVANSSLCVPKLVDGSGCMTGGVKAQPTTQKGHFGDKNIYIIIAAVAGGVVLLVTVLAIVCLVRRRNRKNMKQPAKTDVNGGAHDNPTYMSPDEVGIPTQVVTVVMTPERPHHDDTGIYEHIHPRMDTTGGAAAPDDVYLEAVVEDKSKLALEDTGPVVSADDMPEFAAPPVSPRSPQPPTQGDSSTGGEPLEDRDTDSVDGAMGTDLPLASISDRVKLFEAKNSDSEVVVKGSSVSFSSAGKKH